MLSVPVVEVASVIRVASAVETDEVPYDEATDRVVMVVFLLKSKYIIAAFLLTSNAVSWFLLQLNVFSETLWLTSNAVSWLYEQLSVVIATFLLKSNAVSWL